MQLTIYRGTREVGGTMIEIKTQNTRVLLDAGYPLFSHGEVIDDELAKKPYQELLELGIIPKVKGLYRWEKPEFDAYSGTSGRQFRKHPDTKPEASGHFAG